MINKLHLAMIELYRGDAKRIQHFCKVHSYAKLIAETENVDEQKSTKEKTADQGRRAAATASGSTGSRIPVSGENSYRIRRYTPYRRGDQGRDAE